MKRPPQDPASLDNLRDIVLPPEPPWWPPAPGWFVLGAALLLAGALVAWLAVRSTMASRYRRAALAHLHEIESQVGGAGRAEALRRLPELLKRTALVAFPRERIAALSGEAWLAFLDHSGGTTAFTTAPGSRLVDLAYRPEAAREVSEDEARQLLDLARHWISHHRAFREEGGAA